MSTQPNKLSFSKAYERLREITDELNSATELSPSELITLLEEGKGLEKALREHLEEVSGRVEAIERGEGISRYVIDGSMTTSTKKATQSEPTEIPKEKVKDEKLAEDKPAKKDPDSMSWEF